MLLFFDADKRICGLVWMVVHRFDDVWHDLGERQAVCPAELASCHRLLVQVDLRARDDVEHVRLRLDHQLCPSMDYRSVVHVYELVQLLAILGDNRLLEAAAGGIPS